jgi:hypothetical protein
VQLKASGVAAPGAFCLLNFQKNVPEKDTKLKFVFRKAQYIGNSETVSTYRAASADRRTLTFLNRNVATRDSINTLLAGPAAAKLEDIRPAANSITPFVKAVSPECV